MTYYSIWYTKCIICSGHLIQSIIWNVWVRYKRVQLYTRLQLWTRNHTCSSPEPQKKNIYIYCTAQNRFIPILSEVVTKSGDFQNHVWGGDVDFQDQQRRRREGPGCFRIRADFDDCRSNNLAWGELEAASVPVRMNKKKDPSGEEIGAGARGEGSLPPKIMRQCLRVCPVNALALSQSSEGSQEH